MHQNVIQGETETLQFQIQGLGGTQRWMETFAAPFHNPITKQVEQLAVTHDISKRKQAEEELQKSELFLRSTLDILPANIAIVDDHGTVCLVNKAWREFAEENGVEAPEVSEGTNYFHICDQAWKNGDHEAASFADGIQKILSGEISSFALEYPCISPEKERWFVGRVKRFSINDRYFAAIVHVDITDIKLAERDLRESESRLQAVIDGSLSVIYIKDLESRYFMVNRRYAEVLNIEKEGIVGRNDFDLFPAKTAEEFQGNDRTALASPVPLMFEEITPHTDGPHTYLSNKFAFRDTNGEPYAICGISTDITELKQKEAELQNSEERIRRILDTLPAAAYTCDKNGLITYFNEPATILWGRQPQLNDPLDQYCGSFRLSNPDTTELAHDQCWMAKAINENRAISGKEARIQRPDGTVRSVLAHASPLRDATGSVIGGINVLVDVTKQQHTQTALKKSEQAIRTLYEVTSAQDLTFDEKIRALLKLGCQHFGLPLGTLTKRVEDQLEVEYLHALDTTWTEHMLIPICESFCGLTLERPEPLVCEHVKYSKWKSLPAYKALGLEAYIGTRVITGDHIYGSLCFLDHQPYPGTFSHSTIDFLQLMARWIGSELERKHAEQALHQANDRLRTLSQQLLTVQETERHQLARDLHDEIGQTLTAVKLNLQSLQHKQVPAEPPGVLVDSLDILDHMLKHVRELSLDLRPSMLDDLGLVSAVRWLVNRQAERVGWTTTIRIEEGLPALPQEFATASFRVVQEALTNITRHAQASNVHVELHTDEKEIELHITDDGIGFDSVNVMGQNATGQAFGLLSMHERVRFLKGRLTIISQRGKGTKILAKLPLPTAVERTTHG